MNIEAQNIDYPSLLTDIIHKQMIILGRNFPILLSRTIKGIAISDDGKVTEISLEPQKVTRELIAAFQRLSVTLTSKTIMPIVLREAGKTLSDEVYKYNESLQLR